MAWQFTIHDFTTGTEVVTTIQEPVGWDAVNLHLKRDEKAHGFFSFENDVFSSLQFDGNGAELLRNAYYNYGVQAKVLLGVAYACSDTDLSDNLYLGTFDFTTFKDSVGDRCYVECATYVSEAYMLYNNRRGQQVDLDSLASYDQLPVSQTLSCNAIFQAGSAMIGQSFGQIKITQLLNGLMPGSKITVTGSVSNNGTFTVASSKPDYSNVNPDLAGGGGVLPGGQDLSATFDAGNMTISINQLLNIAAGTSINISTATWPSGDIHFTVYDNSGTYNVLSVQQFFNYTVLSVSLASLNPVTPGNTLNDQGTPYMVSTSQDTVLISGTIIYTAQPTATIITVAEPITPEASVTITLNGLWLKNNMQPYTALGKIITVPPKVIEATSIYKQVEDGIYDLALGDAHAHGSLGAIRCFITPSLVNIQSDIDETEVGTGIGYYQATNPYNGGFGSTHGPDTLIFFRQESLACAGTASLKFNINYQYIPYDSGDGQNYIVGTSLQSLQAHLIFQVGSDPLNITGPPLASYPIDEGVFPMSMANVSGEIDNFQLNPGEYLWMWMVIPVTNNTDAYYPKLLIGAGSTLQVTINSQCVDTPCSVYLVNEALSRCAESYTNGELQVYSDYFGRKNAQPVASSADGCGGLACITNGLRIRGCVMPDSSSIPKFFTSLDDMLTALDAIHNIGWAMEPDPHRTGKFRLRVEPFEHWFNNTVLLTCQNIMNYTRETVPSLMASTFKCGYQQFETWNNNGLYDIFGSRTYRTPLNHLTNEIDKTSKWMASDYAIEFTRRQFGVTTSDSRYDGATFILSLINQWKAPLETIANCMYIYHDGLLLEATFIIGGTLTISGTISNNHTSATIIGITAMPSNPNLACVVFTPGVPVDEFAPAATFTSSVGSYTAVYPAYFVGGNGIFILDELDLFNAVPNDQLVIGNTAHSNGTYTISKIFSPTNAFIDGVSPTAIPMFDFPMVIYPTSTTHVPGHGPQQDLLATISDITNQFYAVEQGMKNGTNILSPDTVMNYRISPAHAAMRHYRNVITDRQYATENLIFTGGEGNFYALGTISDTCSPENDNISEGGNLSLSNFTDEDDGKPLFYPEIVKFEYPLTWAQFLAIQANPYGLIQYEHTNEGLQSGWLVDLQYHPHTGLAEFQLYPKI